MSSELVDSLAQIASSAIKRIEVLRDGASAQYGSDAIAGVINIILDDSVGFEAGTRYSQYYHWVRRTYSTNTTNQANRGLIYSRNAPYDTDGGQYYLRLDTRL